MVSLLVSSPIPAFAQDELPVKLKADMYRYDRRTRVLTATGNVVLTVQDVVIHADALVANLDTGEVTAEGHVRLEVGGQSVVADVLTYNLNTRLGALANARTDYSGPLVLGSVHLRAQRLEGILNEFASAKTAFATTCDDSTPVLYLTAEEISVFPNDKIVGRNVSIWVAGRQIYTLPYFLIFLRERRESRLTPVVGYNDVEGWFVKTTYSYFINENHYGFIHADLMERIGIGTGIEHLYRIGGGQGAALLYRLANKQTGGADVRAVLNHFQEFGENFKARLYMDYLDRTFATQSDQSNFFAALDLSTSTADSSTFVFSTLSSSSVGPTSTFTSRLEHNRAFSPEFFSQLVVDLTRASTPAGRQDALASRVTFRYIAERYTASLVTETGGGLTGVASSPSPVGVQRLPELNVSLFPVPLGGTPFVGQLEVGLGRFRETSISAGLLDAMRADVLATVTGPIQVGPGTLGTRLFSRSTWYSTGNTRLFYGGRVDYTVPLGSSVETRIGYTGQTVQGRSPFQFDQITGTISVADAQVIYQSPQVVLRTTGFYDFQTNQFGNVITQAIYLPRPNWTIGVAASYNPNISRLDRVEANLDLRFSPEWQFQYIGAFDGLNQRLLHDKVAVTRVFCDCLAVSLSYLGTRNEIWLESWLTAIPWTRGRLGIGGRGTLLIDQPIPFVGPP